MKYNKLCTKLQVRNFLCKEICTCLGIGKSKVAPGTLASFATVLAFYWLPEVSQTLLILSLLFCTLIGTSATSIYSSISGVEHDSKEIVIDEVCGQMLTLALVQSYNIPISGNYCILLISFLYFRLLDIMKPFPISWVDSNVKNAFGIILDDLLAGLGAGFLAIVTLKYYGVNVN